MGTRSTNDFGWPLHLNSDVDSSIIIIFCSTVEPTDLVFHTREHYPGSGDDLVAGYIWANCKLGTILLYQAGQGEGGGEEANWGQFSPRGEGEQEKEEKGK